jgi:hypothetical protein
LDTRENVFDQISDALGHFDGAVLKDYPNHLAEAEAASELIRLAVKLAWNGINIGKGMMDIDSAFVNDLQEENVALIQQICALLNDKLFDFRMYQCYGEPEKLKAYEAFFERALAPIRLVTN